MNKTHRIVWSEGRQSYVVTHEKAAARGKPSSVRKAVAHTAVFAVLTAMGASQAATITIDGTNPQNNTYFILPNGDNLVVASDGSISDSVGNGVSVTGSAGFVSNSGTIVGIASGLSQFPSTLSGGLTNSGTIVGGGYAGISQYQGTLNGGLTNSGTIGGGRYGIYQSYSTLSGGLTNSGSIIRGGDYGIYQSQSTLSGGLTNSGSIGGGRTGIYQNNSTLSGGLTNSGTIAGGASGIYQVSNTTLSGGLTNSGTIEGLRGAGISQSLSTLNGGLTNSGSIRGFTGIYQGNSTLNGGLTNSGTIGGGVYGITLQNSSTLSDGLTNSGSIGGGTYGISLNASTLSGGLTNSGTIAATGTYVGTVTGHTGTATGQFAIAVGRTSSLDSIVIAGNNTARFQGIVFADATPMSIASGATYTLRGADDFRVASFTNNGTALFDSTTPSFTVANVGDQTFRNAGTLKVADAQIGTIVGNYTQSGTLSVGASSASSHGQLAVTGTATLSSGAKFAVDVASDNTLANGNTLSGILTAGTLENNAGTLSVTDNSALFDFTASVNGNQVDLVTKPGTNALTAVQQAGNTGAIGAASVIDGLVTGSVSAPAMASVVTALGQLPTNPQVAEAVKETLPLLSGGTTAATTSALGSINRVIQSRLDGNRGMSSGDGFLSDRHLWFKPFASWADQNDKGGINGYKSNLSGAAFGGDAAVSDKDRLGAAVAYASADVKSNNGSANRAKVDVYQLIGYGSHSLDANTELNFQADFGSNINRGRRSIAFMGTTATSNYRSTSYHLGAGLSRTYALSEATSVTPSLRADYTHVRDGGYSENGAGALNLNVAARTTEEMLWSADVKLAHKLKDSLTLVANGGLAYDSKAKAASITAAYAGAPGMGFTTTGIKPDATTFRGGIGLVSTPENGPEITGRYDVEHRNGYTNQTVSAKARWVF